MKQSSSLKQIDFENGGTLSNILSAALPMLVAQILNLLYNIVDRIYIARIHGIGTAALGAVGLCFPIVILISAFTNMYGSGGAPLFSMVATGMNPFITAGGYAVVGMTTIIVGAVANIILDPIFCRMHLKWGQLEYFSLSQSVTWLAAWLALSLCL